MFIVEAHFFRIPDGMGIEEAVAGLQSALECLEWSHSLKVLHDPRSPWLVVKDRIVLSGNGELVFNEALASAGLARSIYITWDDQWFWTTYRHQDSLKTQRHFLLHPEPDEGQSPWIINLGEKEPWETYLERPGDGDLQKMAAFHELPGITHTGKLNFPDEWQFEKELVVTGTKPVEPPLPHDPDSLLGLMNRAVNGETLSIHQALRLMQSLYAPLSMKHVSAAMLTHRVYVRKKRWFRRRDALRGIKGERLVIALSSLDDYPGFTPDELRRYCEPIFVLDLLDQLGSNEGLYFDPYQKEASLQVYPKDKPSFRKIISSASIWD